MPAIPHYGMQYQTHGRSKRLSKSTCLSRDRLPVQGQVDCKILSHTYTALDGKDALVFNSTYGSKESPPSSILWSQAVYSPQEIVARVPTVFPELVCVESGFFGNGNIDSVASGQIVVVQGVHKQRRVVALSEKDQQRYYSMPLTGYAHNFIQLPSSQNKYASLPKKLTLDALLAEQELPVSVKFAENQLHQLYGNLMLVKLYDELYIYGHNISGGCICQPMSVIPAYLDITLSLAEGVIGGNASDWQLLKNAYVQESQRLLKDVRICGYMDMAIFDSSWQNRQPAGEPKHNHKSIDCSDSYSSDDEDDYSYVQPSGYLKIAVDLANEDHSSQSRFQDPVQVEGSAGVLSRLLGATTAPLKAAHKNTAEQSCSPPSGSHPPPLPPRRRQQAGSESAEILSSSSCGQSTHSLPQKSSTKPMGYDKCESESCFDESGGHKYPVHDRLCADAHATCETKWQSKAKGSLAQESTKQAMPSKGVTNEMYCEERLWEQSERADVSAGRRNESAPSNEARALNVSRCANTPEGYEEVDAVEQIALMHMNRIAAGSQHKQSTLSAAGRGPHKGSDQLVKSISPPQGSCHPRPPAITYGAESPPEGKEYALRDDPQDGDICRYRPLPKIPTHKSSLLTRSDSCSALSLSASQRENLKPGVPSSGRSFSDSSTSGHVYTGAQPVAAHSCSSAFKKLPDIPAGNIAQLSNEQLCQSLQLLGMARCAEAFEEDATIDGQLLMGLQAADLCGHFGFTEFEAKKIIMFAHGWRPRQK